MASYLGDYCGDPLRKPEILVFQEKPTNSAEVDGAEKILQVDVEHVPFLAMLNAICHDRAPSLKSVSDMISSIACGIDLVNAVVQQIGNSTL